jgi:hypothetical protein
MGFKSPQLHRIKALTRKNAGQGLEFVYVILNHPPKTPHKRLGAATFVGGLDLSALRAVRRSFMRARDGPWSRRSGPVSPGLAPS